MTNFIKSWPWIHLLSILPDKWEVSKKPAGARWGRPPLKDPRLHELALGAELDAFFSFTWKNKTKSRSMRTWVFSRHLLKNEQNESITSRKTTHSLAFKQKWELQKSYTCHHKLDSLPTLQGFLIWTGLILKNVIFIYRIMKCVKLWKSGVTW